MSTCTALLVLVACATRERLPAVDAGSPEARRIAEAAHHAEYGSDTLEAFELLGLSQPIRFAVARLWQGDSVRVRSHVIWPEALAGAGFLVLREPGERPQVWLGTGRGAVRRVGTSTRMQTGEPTSLASEVVQPVLPGDFSYELLADELIAGEPCQTIAAHPAARLRGVSHLLLYVSRSSGRLVRRVYLDGDDELRRVDFGPAEGEAPAGLRQWRIETADGTRVEIVLHNRLPDAYLPPGLFTTRTLGEGRFPRF